MKFLIGLGAEHCGTTLFFDLFKQHPEINCSVKKEIHFFDSFYSKGENWYLNHFFENNKINFEISPYYMFYDYSVNRLVDFSRKHDVKFLVFLRDPVQRAISHWKQEIKKGHEQFSFETAIALEVSRLNKEKDKFLNGEFSYNYNHFSYKARGKYYNQLVIWLNTFPRENFEIIRSEDLYSSPTKILKKVENFCGLNKFDYDIDIIEGKQSNFKHNISDNFQYGLYNYFEEYNNMLYSLIDRNMNWKFSTTGKDFKS